MKNKLILLLLLIGQGCQPALADEDKHQELVRLTAHAGASYAITMISYGAFRKGLKLSHEDSLLLSVLTAVATGIAYKAIEGGNDYLPATMKNMVGVFGAVGTIKVYEW